MTIQVTFEKILQDSGKNHKFLCNDGQKDCSSQDGTIIYLTHLQFSEPLAVYDATVIPFTGLVTVSDTGCGLFHAEVCLVEKTTVGVENILSCSKTKMDGMYVALIIVGSTVHKWYMTYYYNHTFELALTNTNDYDGGISVDEGGV